MKSSTQRLLLRFERVEKTLRQRAEEKIETQQTPKSLDDRRVGADRPGVGVRVG